MVEGTTLGVVCGSHLTVKVDDFESADFGRKGQVTQPLVCEVESLHLKD